MKTGCFVLMGGTMPVYLLPELCILPISSKHMAEDLNVKRALEKIRLSPLRQIQKRDSYYPKAYIETLVCAENDEATEWFSQTFGHEGEVNEKNEGLKNNFRAGLKNWSEKNNGWPERIVIYRNSVNEGQIPYNYNIELKQMQEEKEGLEKASFVFIIVTKRVNARFFHRIGERELGNPLPGTKIDSIITRKERYDFYLISQSVRQGTVNPTMYNIIVDNTKWRAIHQQLAYKLCHLYYNWAGTITVPAPCQYAHKLAFLTGTALHREHHQDFSHTLFGKVLLLRRKG